MTNRHVFVFNDYDNGGEAISLVTEAGEDYYNQSVSLDCYGKACSISVADVFTPKALRDLADELEKFLSENNIVDFPKRKAEKNP